MSGDLLVNLLLVLFFVLVGGLFAGTEMAIVSLRHGQVRQLAASGPRGERIAALVEHPNTFLSAVQIGVTLAGFFSSAYGAATIAPDIAPGLEAWGMSDEVALTVSLVLSTLLIAYLSLVLGELVPKRMAMQRAVGFTRVLAPPLNAFARLVRPMIWGLSRSTDLVVRLLGGDPKATREDMTADELQEVVSSHESLLPDSRQILTDVLRAAERRLSSAMTPRPDVVFVRAVETVAETRPVLEDHTFSRYPVIGADTDDVLGFVHLRDVLTETDPARPMTDLMRPIVVLPETNHVLQALTMLRAAKQHIAQVIDEHGGTAGIVTLEDLVEELVGEIYDEYDVNVDPEDSVLRQGREITLDASLSVEEFEVLTGLDVEDGRFDTVAGFVVDRLGRLAEEGDRVEEGGVVVEVLQVADNRIGRVRVTRAAG